MTNQITFICDDYDGFVFANAENLRKGPLGEVADYQIVKAPAKLRAEVGCWLTLPTKLMAQQ